MPFPLSAGATVSILSHGAKKERFNYSDIRRDLTSKILIGLEFFVAADLMKTILDPTINQVIILGAIVAIRTVIEYSLTRELKEFKEKP
jgi:uncharacterized membrane protein